jgi:hypothetical protein
LTTKNIKTAADVIAEFLDIQAEVKSIDAGTVTAVSTLWKNDDLSRVKLLRKLEEARKIAFKADAVNAEEAGSD